MRSRASAGILALTFSFLLIGLLVRRWEILSLVIPLLLYLYLGTWLHRGPMIDLEATRTLETVNAIVGDEIKVVVRIENRAERIDFAEAVDPLPAGVQLISGSNVRPISLAAKASCVIEYRVRFPSKGRYVWNHVRVRWNDPGQMNSREIVLPSVCEVQVFPRMQDLKKSDLRPHRVRMHLGNVPSAMLGPGLEFYGIREYADGDELKHINWRASMRSEGLLTNEYRTERSGDVVIIVDGRGTGMDQAISERLLDGCIEVAASVSAHLLKQRNRVGMIILGEFIDVVRLAPGHRQFLRISDALLNAKVGEGRSLKGLNLMLERHFPRTAMLLIVSPLEEARMREALETMLAQQREMIVISPSPVALQAASAPASPNLDLALRVSRAHRHDVLARFGRYCRVIDWEIGTPLSPHLLEVRGSRPKLRI